NTATSLGADGGGTTWDYATGLGDTSAPRWNTPAELDFGRYAWATNAPLSEIRRQLNARLAGFPGVPLSDELVPGSLRESFWNARARLYTDPDYPAVTGLYNITDLHELMHKNGINDSG